jgi:hypothetical protein
MKGERGNAWPSAAEAAIGAGARAVRLEVVPFPLVLVESFSKRTAASIDSLTARLEAAPFQNKRKGGLFPQPLEVVPFPFVLVGVRLSSIRHDSNSRPSLFSQYELELRDR